MPSIRLRVLRACRDALDPLFPDGGAQLWRQDGNTFAEGATALLRIADDTVIGRVEAHAGRYERELSIVVDVSVQTPPEGEGEATPGTDTDESTDELLDAHTMAVEAALSTVDLSAIFGDQSNAILGGESNVSPDLVDTVPFGTATGQSTAGATVRFALKYQHLVSNPAAA